MQPAKTILSHLLLAIYLLVVLHQSADHSHAAMAGQNAAHPKESTHLGHHHHHHHGGFFHLLVHLFENINHPDDFAEEHLVSFQKISGQKIAGNKLLPADIPAFFQDDFILSVSAASLSGPPAFTPAANKVCISLAHPLRGPPVNV